MPLPHWQQTETLMPTPPHPSGVLTSIASVLRAGGKLYDATTVLDATLTRDVVLTKHGLDLLEAAVETARKAMTRLETSLKNARPGGVPYSLRVPTPRYLELANEALVLAQEAESEQRVIREIGNAPDAERG